MYFNIIGTVTDIEYDVAESDFSDLKDSVSDEELANLIAEAKKSIEEQYGKEIHFYLTSEDVDLDDIEDFDLEDEDICEAIEEAVCDYISDKTGYCIYSFSINWDSVKTKRPEYQVGCFAYDKRNRILDSCVFSEHSTKRAAIRKAETIKSVDQVFGEHPNRKKIKYMGIEVEEVLQVGDDETENFYTVWESSIDSN